MTELVPRLVVYKGLCPWHTVTYTVEKGRELTTRSATCGATTASNRTTMKHKLIDAATALGRSVPALGADATGYECALCRYSYEEERPNCPACGGPVREVMG